MLKRATPMLHVPDVDAAADWYEAIGFVVRDRGSDGAAVIWALLSAGDSELMLSAGGAGSAASRRDADLYVHVEDLDAEFARVNLLAEVVEPPHDTFYGMREFIVRDLNGFWVSFGEPIRA